MPSFSRHALQRGVELALDASEIRECATAPTSVYPAKEGRVHYVRGRIKMVVDPVIDQIVTIGWNKPGIDYDIDDLSLCRDGAIRAAS